MIDFVVEIAKSCGDGIRGGSRRLIAVEKNGCEGDDATNDDHAPDERQKPERCPERVTQSRSLHTSGTFTERDFFRDIRSFSSCTEVISSWRSFGVGDS